MEYKSRELEHKFLKMNKVFKVLLVTGARQVGKSTINMTYYRDTNQKEIDVVIEEGGVRCSERTGQRIGERAGYMHDGQDIPY